MNTLKGLCARKLLQCSAKHQLSTAFCLLRHAGALISALGENSPDIDDRESKLEDGALHLSTKSLICIALQGPNHEGKVDASEKEMTPTEFRCIMLVTANILALARNTLSSPSAKKMIRNEQEDAKVCLELWRELMHILNRVQSNIGDDEFWNAGRQLLQNCLSLLQRLLPVPHFLASVMALVKDEDLEPKLRRKALLVLGERGAEVSPRSGEGLLFLETITDLLSICSDSKISLESTDKRQISLHQSAFMAIEGLARSICVPKIAGLLSTRESTILQSALDKISLLASEFVAQLSANLQAFQESSTSFVHLISSSLLCSATLASLLGAKALPALKRLISTITSVLKIVGPNSFALTENENTGPQESMLLLISSTLRALAALIDSVPQFLGPYLPEFFEVSVFSSRNLRCHIELRQHVEKIEEALASNIPARQLIPAVATNLSKSMKISDESSWKEVQNLLHLMEMSIKKSSKSDLAAVMSKSISAIMTAATYSEEVGRFMILSSASQALVALVMKLSESQLRPLFLKMREWKGDLSSDRNDSRDSLQSSVRRYAFWTITAKLTTELRSLFLPCLSAVVTDLVDELEFAASRLSLHGNSAEKKRTKRRKLSSESEKGFELEDNLEMEQLRTLQPVLLTLEAAMKADAHDGGCWARADDGNRFQAILSPLSNLLHAHVPHNFPILSDGLEEVEAYDKIIRGVGTIEYGNVVACFTAMAAALGNEQLWKPLNHSLLAACGDEERSEVRKVGVAALLSIIRTVGEDYMVLLPECLPVLSELIEHNDEEIASMAKECIRLGEELLGESLESTLW